MYGSIKQFLSEELTSIEENGLMKKERIITSPQGAKVNISTGEEVIVMCANNYLGLSSHAGSHVAAVSGFTPTATRWAISIISSHP